MINTTSALLDEGKKSLDTLLRKKAYDEVVDKLLQEDIDINSVAVEDIETLVSASVRDKINGIKSFAVGGAFVALLSSVIGF